MSDTAIAESPAPLAKAAQKLLNDFETLGVPVDDSERKEIAAISDSQMALEFIEMRLDRGLKPAELKRTGILASTLFREVELDPVMLVSSMYSMGICRRVIEHADNRLQGKEQDGSPSSVVLSEEAILGTEKLMLLGAVELSKMTTRCQKLAVIVKGDKKPTGPRNKPFDSLAPQPTLIQNNAGGTVVVNSEKQT